MMILVLVLPPDPNPVYLMRMYSLVMQTAKQSGLVLVSRAKTREERLQTRHIHIVVLAIYGTDSARLFSFGSEMLSFDN